VIVQIKLSAHQATLTRVTLRSIPDRSDLQHVLMIKMHARNEVLHVREQSAGFESLTLGINICFFTFGTRPSFRAVTEFLSRMSVDIYRGARATLHSTRLMQAGLTFTHFARKLYTSNTCHPYGRSGTKA
jgi:hypothetical protein